RELKIFRLPDLCCITSRYGRVDRKANNSRIKIEIDFAQSIHRECPDLTSFQYRILNALQALGRNENDFNWTIRPAIVYLTEDFVDRCYGYLRPKRNPRSIHELTFEIGAGNYLAFSEDELLQCLKQDARFVVDGDHPVNADLQFPENERTEPTEREREKLAGSFRWASVPWLRNLLCS
ncbi:MAG: hypothetical protein KDB03_25320, partial [Planctomycetales bacterium]|nr:hypothetical protein [Planctomycetales bacterium]